ncbi:MAG: pectin acetylesterase-family hydrolase [Myxococcota bacterium]|nr:pectin acetylesterase-family hydrolase [Myxococcota bacterium]
MILFLFACVSDEKNDTMTSDTHLSDGAEDTASMILERPENLQGWYIDNERYPKAVCNDGSTPIFYLRPGIEDGRDKWILWFEGGGTCFSVEGCRARWQNESHLMSTCVGENCAEYAADVEKSKDGILSSLADENPHLHDWNHVLLNYCSSDAWLGQREESLNTGLVELFFRGHYIAEATLSTLLGDPVANGYPSLADATEVVVAGSSAGATGMRGHVDAFSERLRNAQVRALSDATMVPIVQEEGEEEHIATRQEQMEVWNAFTDQSCRAQHPDTIHQCIDGTFLLEKDAFHTPIFFHQDQSDPKAYSSNASAVGVELSEEEKMYVHEEIRTLFSQYANGAYIPRKGNHVVVTTEQFHDRSLLNDISLADAFWEWYQSGNAIHIEP